MKQLQSDHGLMLDEEVSFTSKLYATTHEIEHAAHLGGFDGAMDYATPVGNPETLNSPRFKLRLLLNALTTPHILLTGDQPHLPPPRRRRRTRAALLALRISGARKLLPRLRAPYCLLRKA
ncbi:hypothetical protein [Streptomyces aureus]|uniref:hypothetical protein n=1 Tax=Streptomyces aureus TaxID=193461 RepID=UPI0006E417DF|nr:hypothetical protein [Streptomyces aureus]